MSLDRFGEIAGILFDKDGTLIRYDESWGPVNREAARIAAAGRPDLELPLLKAAGMDPVSGHTLADSLFAAGNAAEIAAGFVAAGSPLAGFEITEYVDFVAGYDSGFGSKPEPGMVLGFCAATGLPPARIAMVGDNNHDMMMGAGAGALLKIGVLTGTGTRESLEPHADICLSSIAALTTLLPPA
jgi:phosphoglycolate phosphatase